MCSSCGKPSMVLSARYEKVSYVKSEDAICFICGLCVSVLGENGLEIGSRMPEKGSIFNSERGKTKTGR